MEKYRGRGVIWSVAPESNIHECEKFVSETLKPIEYGILPECIKVHIPVDLSILLRKDLTLSMSS